MMSTESASIQGRGLVQLLMIHSLLAGNIGLFQVDALSDPLVGLRLLFLLIRSHVLHCHTLAKTYTEGKREWITVNISAWPHNDVTEH